MNYALIPVTPPAALPLTRAEAKGHLRLDGDEDDPLVDALIAAAAGHLDGPAGILGRALMTQTWDVQYDGFPARAGEPLRLPLPPLQQVTSVAYVDGDGAAQTWAAPNWRIAAGGGQPAALLPAWGQSWPATRDRVRSVTVRMVAGYGSAASDIPAPLRQAMLLLLGHWYENRETVTIGTIATETPWAAEALLAPWRARWG